MEWQPFESSPRSGWFLAYDSSEGDYSILMWNDDFGCCLDTKGELVFLDRFVSWIPLPAPPTA